jgi:hypothetical protein
MLSKLDSTSRDCREPRKWARVWQDAPGYFGPGWRNCNCCGVSLYILGGTNLTGTWYATADKINMSAETAAAAASANLSTARAAAGAASNPSVAGYICGGQKVGNVDTNIGDKMTMSNDTTSATSSANLSYSNRFLAGLSERSSKAYFAGGQTSFVVTADLLTFSSDTNAATSTANLSTGRGELAGMNATSAKGYWAGGDISPGGITHETKIADKITFSSDTTSAQTSANLSTARAELVGGSDGSTKGYWYGGDQGGTNSGLCDKIVASTDTTSSLVTGNAHSLAGGGSDGNKFMLYGGQDNLSPTNQGDEMLFATDTTQGAGGTLSQSRYEPCGFSGSAL